MVSRILRESRGAREAVRRQLRRGGATGEGALHHLPFVLLDALVIHRIEGEVRRCEEEAERVPAERRPDKARCELYRAPGHCSSALRVCEPVWLLDRLGVDLAERDPLHGPATDAEHMAVKGVKAVVHGVAVKNDEKEEQRGAQRPNLPVEHRKRVRGHAGLYPAVEQQKDDVGGHREPKDGAKERADEDGPPPHAEEPWQPAPSSEVAGIVFDRHSWGRRSMGATIPGNHDFTFAIEAKLRIQLPHS